MGHLPTNRNLSSKVDASERGNRLGTPVSPSLKVTQYSEVGFVVSFAFKPPVRFSLHCFLLKTYVTTRVTTVAKIAYLGLNRTVGNR